MFPNELTLWKKSATVFFNSKLKRRYIWYFSSEKKNIPYNIKANKQHYMKSNTTYICFQSGLKTTAVLKKKISVENSLPLIIAIPHADSMFMILFLKHLLWFYRTSKWKKSLLTNIIFKVDMRHLPCPIIIC